MPTTNWEIELFLVTLYCSHTYSDISRNLFPRIQSVTVKSTRVIARRSHYNSRFNKSWLFVTRFA